MQGRLCWCGSCIRYISFGREVWWGRTNARVVALCLVVEAACLVEGAKPESGGCSIRAVLKEDQ